MGDRYDLGRRDVLREDPGVALGLGLGLGLEDIILKVQYCRMMDSLQSPLSLQFTFAIDIAIHRRKINGSIKMSFCLRT
jgi:hypothetical protein